MRHVTAASIGLVMMVATAGAATAQTSSVDPSARLASVLPTSVARHVLSVMDAARSEGLPADALGNRSLKFAARGVAPDAIARAADDQLLRMRTARDVLRNARAQTPRGDEIEAGAEAMREGVDGAIVSKLARSAPSGRSLTVPLFVIGSLVSRGVPSDEALSGVQRRLLQHASDADIRNAGQAIAASHRPATNPGRGFGVGGRPASVGAHPGGPPQGVPGNAGTRGRPSTHPGNGNAPSTPGRGHP